MAVCLCLTNGVGSWRALAARTEERAAGEVVDREHQIKAALLLNFIRYTTWPEESLAGARPITLAVIGKDPFSGTLEATFRAEEAHGRKIEVGRSKDVPATIESHVVFCGELARVARQELLAKCARRHVLLIGESPEFAREGASINFFIQDQKVRFEINADALAAAELQLSPAVLKLAKIVQPRKEDG